MMEILKIVAMLGFFLGFLAIVTWAYLPRNRKAMRSHADIPFKDQDHERK